MYQRIGPAAYKKDLTNTIALLEWWGNPQHAFKAIHIAGTNGKGSVSHMLASTLQESGYKTGLYTSPHLRDFRERMKLNGKCVSEEFVIQWTEKSKEIISEVKPSFFEMTVAMAFSWFREQGAAVAVVETGLGGRLDSTNVVSPLLSIITNIGLDHQAMLGDTLEKIAFEKAGIIKAGVPVIIGKRNPSTDPVFNAKAKETGSRLTFAEDNFQPSEWRMIDDRGIFKFQTGEEIICDLPARYQAENIATVLVAASVLMAELPQISQASVHQGLSDVKRSTGLRGRWDIVGRQPEIILDIAHNQDGMRAAMDMLGATNPLGKLKILIGMVADKDHCGVIELLPKNADYYVCAPALQRALSPEMLAEKLSAAGLKNCVAGSVELAAKAAIESAGAVDTILITGSAFVVAEALDYFEISTC